MAAGTSTPASSTPRPAAPDGVDGKLVEFDHYIESQIHRTRRQVKGVDLSTALMVLAVGTLVYLMLVALVDHWLVSGGLGFAGRLAAFLVLATGGIVYLALRVAPLLLRRINPVYAAHTIERNRPGIKNSLVNFLLLRSSPAGLAPRVYEAMEMQAVNALTAVHSDVPVDRTPLIRLLLALVGIITCVALYGILSPKSPFASFRRVVAPWSDVASPTRVKISDVQPGDATSFHDQQVAVSAEVSGVRSGESVTLYYSTLDGQVVRRGTPMAVPESSYRFTAELPPDSLGLQQDLEYWIEAGDAISPHHQIKVETPPSIVVDKIEYEYPQYSELPPQRVAKQGDLQALEGTRVSLAAAANQDIRRADLDFECDGRNDLSMKIDGRRATVAFTVGWDAKTRRPEHESYQLRFHNTAGHENPKPVRYTIDVIRDLPPEIELIEPQLDAAEETPLRAGSPLRLTVRAADPDFKLAGVKLHARRSGLRLLEEKLLAEPRAGDFTRDYILDSRKLALKPGDAVELWASADDNKQPQANHVETPHYTLRIVSPDAKPRPDQLAKNDRQQRPDDRDQQPREDQRKQPAERNADGQQQQNQQPGEEGEKGGAQGERQHQQREGARNEEGQEGNEGEPSGEKNDARAKGDNKQGRGENSREPNEGGQQGRQGENADPQGADPQANGKPSASEEQRVDPNRDPGKAFEKILEHLQQNQQPGDKDQEKQRPENAGQDPSKQDSQDSKANGQSAADEKQDDEAGGQPDKPQAPKQPQPKGAGEKPEAGPGDDEGAEAEGATAEGDQPRPGGKTGKQPSGGGGAQAEKSGERSNAGAQRKPKVGDGEDSKREAEDGDESAKPAAGEQEPQKGQGDQASGAGEPDEKNPREHGPDREHRGGDPDSKNKGDGGAGQEGESKRGAASPMNEMQAKEKKQTSPAEKTRPLEDEDPAAASESKKSSDSQGQQSGDQAGGGNASGGQRSNSAGVGSAGQNTASEEGGGQSEQKGKGPTGTRGGDQTKGDEPAEGGKASDEKGAGSHQREGGNKAGGPDQAPPEGADLRGHSNDEPPQPRDKAKADSQRSAKPAGKSEQRGVPQRDPAKPDSPDRPDGQPRPSEKGGNEVQPGKPPSAGRSNPTAGGGLPGAQETQPNADVDNSEPGGDDPKLEYTRKATDLALERLQDQVTNNKLDPELLEKLKWTPEDMQRFLRQWQQLKHAAEESGPRSDAARELDEALRSLGLRPRGAALEGSRQPGKAIGGLREGQRTAPPPEYREQYREFSKAKAQGLKKSK